VLLKFLWNYCFEMADKPKVTLYQYNDVAEWGIQPSSFCLKVEAYLKFNGFPLEKPSGGMDHLKRAPKSKLPFVEVNGELIADSAIILRTFQSRFETTDADLTSQQRALGTLITRMCDEHLYWCATPPQPTHRTANTPPLLTTLGFSSTSAGSGTTAGPCTATSSSRTSPPSPSGLASPPTSAAKSTQTSTATAWVPPPPPPTVPHLPAGRHSVEEVFEFGVEDMRALSDILGEKPFMLGDEPTFADAAAFAIVASFVFVPIDNPVTAYALSTPNLKRYCDVINEKYFGGALGKPTAS
jgi:glutathione S-transferase